jgi:energy-coupling factor transporter transmembrane protein EcfT
MRIARLDTLLAPASVALAALLTRHPLPLILLLAALWPRIPRPRTYLVAFALLGLILNGLFSWYGATELWAAPFTLSLMGRPRLTLEALALGAATGLQISVVAAAFIIAFTRTRPQDVARLVPGQGPKIATALALRTLPELARDAKGLRDGLALRGVDVDGVRGTASLLSPLVARSLDRTSQSLELLWVRGAGAPPRAATALRIDTTTILSALMLLLVPILWATGLWPQDQYLPTLALEPVTSLRWLIPTLPLLTIPGWWRRD